MFLLTFRWSYRPEQVLVADEQPHDIGGLLRLSFLDSVRQPAGDGLVEEEVGSHDGGYSPQVHPVPLLPGDHFTEKLKESLREHRERERHTDLSHGYQTIQIQQAMSHFALKSD